MDWIKTAANNAMVSRDELMEWLKVDVRVLRLMIESQGFPQPRIQNGPRVTKVSRWRVGDVRSWIDGGGEYVSDYTAKHDGHPWKSKKQPVKPDFLTNGS